ncbi:hypothetical protein DPMN_066739 [Dreissena polymorpha]|uniref:Uncharacterized protein n=1 Tax=Dreissena polymorpha TaxID=45954 RepID=A0A9D3YZ16_DREPO|nr:hypothetical protein DPMN_066739 [Dreissena polymorpha]
MSGRGKPAGKKRKAPTKLPENQERKRTPPPWRPCFFLPIQTIFKLNCRIQETNVLTKFHDDWTKNVTSRVNCPGPWRPCFSPIWTISKLVRDINETNVLTKFYDD